MNDNIPYVYSVHDSLCVWMIISYICIILNLKRPRIYVILESLIKEFSFNSNKFECFVGNLYYFLLPRGKFVKYLRNNNTQLRHAMSYYFKLEEFRKIKDKLKTIIINNKLKRKLWNLNVSSPNSVIFWYLLICCIFQYSNILRPCEGPSTIFVPTVHYM